jgi:hypothetical protein
LDSTRKLLKYIGIYRSQQIYIEKAITINKLEYSIIKCTGLYSLIKPDSKVLPKNDNVNVAKPAEPILKADSAKIDSSSKAV